MPVTETSNSWISYWLDQYGDDVVWVSSELWQVIANFNSAHTDDERETENYWTGMLNLAVYELAVRAGLPPSYVHSATVTRDQPSDEPPPIVLPRLSEVADWFGRVPDQPTRRQTRRRRTQTEGMWTKHYGDPCEEMPFTRLAGVEIEAIHRSGQLRLSTFGQHYCSDCRWCRNSRIRDTELVCGYACNCPNSYAPLQDSDLDEYEIRDRAAISDDIIICPDGSLSANGMEFKTPPASGSKFVELVSATCAALKEDDWSTNATCGLHVHVDAERVGRLTAARLIETFTAIEPALYLALPERRYTSHYSQPTGHILRRIARHRDNKRTSWLELVEWGSVGDRYHGMNLHALRVHGTVEFRYHEGTIHAAAILPWARFVVGSMEWAGRGRRASGFISKLAGFQLMDRLDAKEVLGEYLRMIGLDHDYPYWERRINRFSCRRSMHTEWHALQTLGLGQPVVMTEDEDELELAA